MQKWHVPFLFFRGLKQEAARLERFETYHDDSPWQGSVANLLS